MHVIADAGGSCSALWQAREIQPDLVVLSFPMARVDGQSLAAALKAALPDARLLGMASDLNPFIVGEVIRDDLDGFVEKDAPLAVFMRAVDLLLSGNRYFTPAFAHVHESVSANPVAFSKILSDREQQVIALVAEGLSSKAIAARLSLSVRTIETHRYNVMQKMDLPDYAAMMRFAIEGGFKHEECDTENYPCSSCRHHPQEHVLDTTGS